MSKEFKVQSEQMRDLEDYVMKLIDPEDSILNQVRKNALVEHLPDIHISAMDGRHLTVLMAAARAEKVVEIGTLAGYSGICLLRGMQKPAKLFTFEMNPKHAAIAKKNFELAGFHEYVDLLIGPALEQLKQIENQKPFDAVFIDADKQGYCDYLEWASAHLKSGGLLIADNTFAWGEVYKKNIDQPTVLALQKFNEKIARDDRFLMTMLPTGEGLTVAVKK